MKLLNLNIAIKLDNNEQVLNFIKKENADICTFQEAMNAVDESCYDTFKSKNKIIGLKEYQYNEFSPLFIADGVTKNNVLEIDWCRSIQNAILDIDGKPLQIINIHGIWNKDKIGDERTIKQSEFILSNIRKDIPVIVVGDFNLLPNTDSIKLLNNELINLIDKYYIKSTRPYLDDGLDKGKLVCDYIFVNDKVTVNDFKVIESNISDHLPLILDFEI